MIEIIGIRTLMLVGALDPLTPPEWAQHALEGLSRGQLYTFPFRSHQVGQTSCAVQVTQSFLEEPEREAEHKCVAESKVLGVKYELFH